MAEEPITLRARLQGYQLAIRESWALARATRGIGVAAETTGRSVEKMSRRSFLMNQLLFTMRRYIYQATLGLTAMTAASAVLGFRFNMNMEKARIGMEFLLKSEQAASDEINYLFELAAKTPFQFQPLTETARTMLAFGTRLKIGVDEVNRILTATADAVSVLGGSQEYIDRITYAFGQMLVKGRVMGEELRQLFNANIPASQYLAEAFNLNAKQLSNIGRLGIPARDAILAIIQGMERDYGGAAQRLSETVWGQTSTLIDYTQQLLGMMMMSPFLLVRDQMPRVLDVIQGMTEAMRDQGFYAMIRVLDEGVGAAGNLTKAIRVLDRNIRALWESGGLLIEVFTPFLKVVGALAYVLLQLTATTLELINKGGKPMVYLIQLLVLWMITERITMKLLILMMKRETAAKILSVFWTKRVNAAVRLWYFTTLAMTTAVRGLTAAVVTLAFALGAIPAGVLGVIGVVAMLLGTAIYLYYRFERLRSILIVFITLMSPLSAAIIKVREHWKGLANQVQRLWDLLMRLDHWLDTHNPLNKMRIFPRDWGSYIPNPWNLIPGGSSIRGAFQHGGYVGVAGRYLVGDRGPEVLSLPAGAMVSPKPYSMDWNAAGAAGINVHITPAPVIVDGREVAEVVFRHKSDRMARR